MDAKDLRTEAALGDRSNDGNTKYAQSGSSFPCHRNKSYQDIGSNSLGKVDGASARPCAVIGPDRVVPPPVSTEAYLKKGPVEPWLNLDNTYRRPPEYPHKMLDYQHPTRNISPRQTFQENMQRIMLPHTYNSAKLKEDHTFPGDPNLSQMRSNKLSVPSDPNPKYCDVPYTVNPVTNEQKNIRSSDISAPNMNTVLTRNAPHGWPPTTANVRPAKPYTQELYQYPEYPSCAGPRPMLMTRPHRVHEEHGPVYPDPYYQDGGIRYKPYPTVKERYPQSRYEYVSNYTNPFHPPPPFPSHKPMPPHPYPGYPQGPIKYIDGRMPDPIMNSYPRPLNPQTNYNNMQFRNQVIHPTFGPIPGNCLQTNKFYPYPTDSSKPIPPNKLPYDINNKMYTEYECSRNKNYPMSEAFYVNDISRAHPMKSQIMPPSYPTNIHSIPPNHPYYRKENVQIKGYEYNSHFRNIDPTVSGNPLTRFQTQFSPSSIAISPSDSNTSNETGQTHGTSQEDCGYVSQSSTTSVRSMDSGYIRMPHDMYRRYDHRYAPVKASSLSKLEPNANNMGSKNKKDIDVRQFLQMWNEGEEESGGDANNKEVVVRAIPNNQNNNISHFETSSHEPLYVLGLVNVPSEELGKYEHIQKVSKLPENIKGYNSIELLHQFEEVIESSNLNNYSMKPSTPRDQFRSQMKGTAILHSVTLPSRPISPLDVEAKISQSVIHKDVGCNFEIKPCSPKMLNVEVAAPVQTILGERVIEKVSNPLIIQSPSLHNLEDNRECKATKCQERNLIENANVASCKMVNTQYSINEPVDTVKTDYSLQDLESSSGVCLASLPRLDNDIELSFPEVNQQFINANKVESVITTAPIKDLPSLDIDQSETVKNSQEHVAEDSNSASTNSAGRDFSKLSKYRRLKKKESRPNTPESNVQALRTDSVIIKNPENVKSYENVDKTASPKNKLEDAQSNPINLTVNVDNREENILHGGENVFAPNQPNEFAIDFSLPTNEQSDCININTCNQLSNEKTLITENHVCEERQCSATNDAVTSDQNTKFDDRTSIRNVLEGSNEETDISDSLKTTVSLNVANNDTINKETNDIPDMKASEQVRPCNLNDTITENSNEFKPYCDENSVLKRENCHIIDKMKELFGEYSPGEIDSSRTKQDSIDTNYSNSNDILNTNTDQFDQDLGLNDIESKVDNNVMDTHISQSDQSLSVPDIESNEIICDISHACIDPCKPSDIDRKIFSNVGDGDRKTQVSEIDISVAKADSEIEEKNYSSPFKENDVKLQMSNDPSEINYINENNQLPSQSQHSETISNEEQIISCETKTDNTQSKHLHNVQFNVSKKLMSPWIQKLITHNEGACTTCVGSNLIDGDKKSTFGHPEVGVMKEESETFECNADITRDTNEETFDIGSCCLSPLGTNEMKLLSPMEDSCESTYNYSDDDSDNLVENKNRQENIEFNPELKETEDNGKIETEEAEMKNKDIDVNDVGNEIVQEKVEVDPETEKKRTKENGQNYMAEPKIKHELIDMTDIEDEILQEKRKENLEFETKIMEDSGKSCGIEGEIKHVAMDTSETQDEIVQEQIEVLSETKVMEENGKKNIEVVESKHESIDTNEKKDFFVLNEDQTIQEIIEAAPANVESNSFQDVILKNMSPQTNFDEILMNEESSEVSSSLNSNISEDKCYNADDNVTETILGKTRIELSKVECSTENTINICNENKTENSIYGLVNSPRIDEPSSKTSETVKMMSNNLIENPLEKPKLDTELCITDPSVPLQNQFFEETSSADTASCISKSSPDIGDVEYSKDDSNLEEFCETQNEIFSTDTVDYMNEDIDQDQGDVTNKVFTDEIENISNFSGEEGICIGYENEDLNLQNAGDSFKNSEYMVESDSQHFEMGDDDVNKNTNTIYSDELMSPKQDVILDQSSKELDIRCQRNLKYNNSYFTKKRKSLKRSLSESALDEICEHTKEEAENSFWPIKRKKDIEVVNDDEANYLANIIHTNRRNSISSLYNGENVSFCILIDNNCIIAEECEEDEKICFDDVAEACLDCTQDNTVSEEADASQEILELQEEVECEYSTSFDDTYPQEEKSEEEPWVEDVACVETVVSDDIAENIVISAATSPKDSDLSDGEYNDENEIYNVNEHTDKLKYIYGEKMCRDDAHFVDTLYRTPQMNVNKTLVYRESQITEECTRYYDKESLERVLSEPEVQKLNAESIVLTTRSVMSSPKAYTESPEREVLTDKSNAVNEDSQNIGEDVQSKEKDNFLSENVNTIENISTVSCEPSAANAISCKSRGDSPISSSPEVSSTTSEEKNSGILLKITNYGGSRMSQINDITPVQSISCKYTEKKEYLSSNNLPTRTLITKGAQKYIPPLKETIPDLKIKLQLPQQSLVKLKQLKEAKESPKPNVMQANNVLKKELPKKSKPKFEDVLKSIDEIQFQKHRDKNKKAIKKSIPKVVIKKSENGSHYASTSRKDTFNPDLTGRKWQPWVFLDKDHFIDKMATRNKTKAIFNHRKNAYVLAEKFQKYRSVSSTKFIISQPKLNDPASGQLKYTIRLKHNY